jgi:hypothetical protein
MHGSRKIALNAHVGSLPLDAWVSASGQVLDGRQSGHWDRDESGSANFRLPMIVVVSGNVGGSPE